MVQKHIKGRKLGQEAAMGFPVCEAYILPMNAKSLVGSVMLSLCGSHYPLLMAMVEASSQSLLIDKAFSASSVSFTSVVTEDAGSGTWGSMG